MLQTLLAQRFHLQIHAELVVARPDEPLHAGIRPSTVDCEDPNEEKEPRQIDKFPPANAERPSVCGLNSRHVAGVTTVIANAVTMSQLASYLQGHVGGAVLDETGLEGRFDMEFTFVEDRAELPDDAALEFLFEAIGEPVPDIAPSASTAFEDQLGLKLESRQGPVDVHVIGHVERPTPD